MGRETRILLGLLGLLAGLFIGVLSLKLLVPRPPAGAGPDVHGDVGFSMRQELVPPPVRGPRAADFAAAPPLVATVTSQEPFASETQGRPAAAWTEPAEFMPVEPPASRFADIPSAADPEPLDAPAITTDPFVQPAAFATEESPSRESAAGGSRFAGPARDEAGMAPEFSVAEPLDEPAAPRSVSRFASAAQYGPDGEDVPPVPAAASAPIAGPPRSAGPIAGGHVVAAGDSWWSLAERAYGDGRLYRALYAWNRARDPRVALVPGTSLEIPPVERLAASWPALMPAAR